MSSGFGPLDLKTKTGRHIFWRSGVDHYGWKYWWFVLKETFTTFHIGGLDNGLNYYNLLSKHGMKHILEGLKLYEQENP